MILKLHLIEIPTIDPVESCLLVHDTPRSHCRGSRSALHTCYSMPVDDGRGIMKDT